MESIYTHKLETEEGYPLPWFTYSAIQYLDSLDLSDKMIFEWGSGNSSSYFAKRCKKIISIESQQDWFDKNIERIQPNQELHKKTQKWDYVNKIKDYDYKFDIIIIDGDWRGECSEVALEKLNDGGIIIFDNSDWLVDTCTNIKKNNLIQIDFYGMGPLNEYAWCTTIFFKRDFNFEPIDSQSPKPPIGGINYRMWN